MGSIPACAVAARETLTRLKMKGSASQTSSRMHRSHPPSILVESGLVKQLPGSHSPSVRVEAGLLNQLPRSRSPSILVDAGLLKQLPGSRSPSSLVKAQSRLIH
jgi:hypothetical protein